MHRLPLENEVLADKYRIERIVGRGGMGVVLSAWHLALDQRVALKCLQPELAQNSESAARFLREARAAAKIKSEHGVRVLDVGNFDEHIPYMVMEFLDGRDLADELRDRGPLPVEECMNYALQAIEAVAEAHSLGIVHRDLKPENLFLARLPDGTRSVKVLDFGISKSMVIAGADNRSLTQSSTIMGSPLYMSPEQMRAPRTVDMRTDIWSLGAIIFELLSGHPPYVADTLPQLCAKMLESDPPPLRASRPDVDIDLERTVTRCLARNVSERWQSMGELAQALLPHASRSARVNAERVARVLNTTDKSARMAPMTLSSRDPVGGTPTRQSARDLDAVAQEPRARTPVSNPQRSELQGSEPDGSRLHGVPIMPVTDTGNTRRSWEAHGRQPTISAHPPSSVGKKVVLVAGAAAALLALSAFIWSRRSAPVSTVTPVLSAADIAPAPARPTAEAVPAAAAPSSPAAPVEAIGNAAASAAPDDPSKKEAAGIRPVESPPPLREPSPEMRIRKSAPPAPSPAAPGKGLTDFGGRR
ncbi:MAG TPA: serine/threonine-protein kinase [Polyangiaceae bacterium]|nr:serine/threonine-protein kinase [Polyangiaceae bacterium]